MSGGGRKYFWLIAVLVILGAAIGGGIGGSTAAKTQSSKSSTVLTSTPSPTSPPRPPTRDTAYSGGSVASVSWGIDSDFELHVFYQDDHLWIRESVFKNSLWSPNATKIVKAGLGTPIAAMFHPYDGGLNTSVGHSPHKPLFSFLFKSY